MVLQILKCRSHGSGGGVQTWVLQLCTTAGSHTSVKSVKAQRLGARWYSQTHKGRISLHLVWCLEENSAQWWISWIQDVLLAGSACCAVVQRARCRAACSALTALCSSTARCERPRVPSTEGSASASAAPRATASSPLLTGAPTSSCTSQSEFWVPEEGCTSALPSSPNAFNVSDTRLVSSLSPLLQQRGYADVTGSIRLCSSLPALL